MYCGEDWSVAFGDPLYWDTPEPLNFNFAADPALGLGLGGEPLWAPPDILDFQPPAAIPSDNDPLPWYQPSEVCPESSSSSVPPPAPVLGPMPDPDPEPDDYLSDPSIIAPPLPVARMVEEEEDSASETEYAPADVIARMATCSLDPVCGIKCPVNDKAKKRKDTRKREDRLKHWPLDSSAIYHKRRACPHCRNNSTQVKICDEPPKRTRK